MRPGRWITLQDGGSDTWLYMRRVGAHAFQFVEVLDMHSATGETHGDRYAGQVDLVDLSQLTPAYLRDAQRSCGWDLDEHELTADQRERALAEMCHSYGCKAPLGSCSSNNRGKCEREMRSLAHECLDEHELEDRLDNRAVNALGSTAREYMTGDLYAAMSRGVVEGNHNARIMAKMYGVSQTDIDMASDSRPSDWLPYLFGYQDGLRDSHTRETDLAPEYEQGFSRGKRVTAGEAVAPGWIKSAK